MTDNFGSLRTSRNGNIYLKEFRKTLMFRDKQVAHLGAIMPILGGYDSPQSRHAYKVLVRWWRLVEHSALTPPANVDKMTLSTTDHNER